jgi:hypothetical protein
MPKTHPLICKAYFTDSLRLSRNWPDAHDRVVETYLATQSVTAAT